MKILDKQTNNKTAYSNFATHGNVNNYHRPITSILTIMLYGTECCALSKADARKVDAMDQWYLRRIPDISWYHHVSNCEVRPKWRLMLFGHLVKMDESADARRILTAVPQSECRKPVGRPYTSWMATLKNDLARHNLTLEDAIELALNKRLWRLLAPSGATYWCACRIMMMMNHKSSFQSHACHFLA